MTRLLAALRGWFGAADAPTTVNVSRCWLGWNRVEIAAGPIEIEEVTWC